MLALERASKGADRVRTWWERAQHVYPVATQRAWRFDWAAFMAFCASHAATPLPASAETVATFVEEQGAAGKRPATIRRYLSTLALAHRVAKLPNPCVEETVELAVRALYKEYSARQRQARALGWSEIKRFLETAGESLPATRERALLCVAYDSMARRGELIVLDAGRPTVCRCATASTCWPLAAVWRERLTYKGVTGTEGCAYNDVGAGNYGYGTVFKITSSGSETVLYSFTGTDGDGVGPTAGLTQGSDGNFYGTTFSGGSYGFGTVFEITTSGTETVLHSFGGGNDGVWPYAGLIQGSDGNFYGTTYSGGTYGPGTVFKITPTEAETVLYSFTGGSDGSEPFAGLIQGSDGNFYGTTDDGGADRYGTVFRVTPAGVATVVYPFTGGSDGGYPMASLDLGNDGNLYGTTQEGGSYNEGTVFKVTLQ